MNAHVAGLNVTENQQDREDSGKESSRRRERARERRQRPDARTRALNAYGLVIVRTQTRAERTTCFELDSSLVDRFKVWSLASL